MKKVSCLWGCAMFLCISLLAIAGCARQEESPQNLQLIAALRTAVSAQNAEWLAQTKTAMQTEVEKGAMSEETAKSFRSIIETAEAGDWSTAEAMTIDLQESRRPSSSAKNHAHDHAH